ncbi:MAG: hypothetical protein J7647_08120 [Cyanobacteria bacterium SBLK]|nr:hypothetical protein [Cyanobacteria bacterium SBLK]
MPHPLTPIFQSLSIQSPDSISFEKTPSQTPDSPPFFSRESQQRLILTLRNTLYHQCYTRPLTALGAFSQMLSEEEDIWQQLSRANCGHTTWEIGWQIQQIQSGGNIIAKRGQTRCQIKAGDYAMTFSEDLQPWVGGAIMVCRRKESLTLQAGVYYAFGNARPEGEKQAQILRFYFHPHPRRAVARIFALITGYLNGRRVPFTLKTLMKEEDRDRVDGTVLYLSQTHYLDFVDFLRTTSGELSSLLKPEVPLFTKPLHPGIGLAESPKTGESFGMNRCRLLAEAIAIAWTRGRQDEAARWQAATQKFASAGLSLERPYLNPGSSDIYTL